MKGKSYGYTATQISSSEIEPQWMEMVLTQLTLNAAIKLWGKDATSAAESEMNSYTGGTHLSQYLGVN
jgi:hypothetical protein